MSRDRNSFFAYNSPGKIFNPMACGVIWNQHSKIQQFELVPTVWNPLRKFTKFECSVIYHNQTDNLKQIYAAEYLSY